MAIHDVLTHPGPKHIAYDDLSLRTHTGCPSAQGDMYAATQTAHPHCAAAPLTCLVLIESLGPQPQKVVLIDPRDLKAPQKRLAADGASIPMRPRVARRGPIPRLAVHRPLAAAAALRQGVVLRCLVALGGAAVAGAAAAAANALLNVRRCSRASNAAGPYSWVASQPGGQPCTCAQADGLGLERM